MKTKCTPFYKLITKCIFSFLFFSVSGLVSADDHHDDRRDKRPERSQNDQHDFNHALNGIKNEIRKAQEKGDRKKVEMLMRRVREMEMSRSRVRGHGERSHNEHRGDRRPEPRRQNAQSPEAIINRLNHQIRDLQNQISGMRREME